MPTIDDENCLLVSDFPKCPRCHGITRPNVLMFGDWCWHEQRTAAQERRLAAWRRQVERLLVIKVGAGTAIPTVRLTSESTAGKLIRINPSEPALGGADGVSIATGWRRCAESKRRLCQRESEAAVRREPGRIITVS